MELTREVLEALSAPFPADELEFLPRSPANGRALALPYIDARSVMRRLDAVVGPANWTFDFDPLTPDGKRVRGKLTVCGVLKCDAGESGSEDEPLKSAVSDALKRAAVHFGIGRYLYYLPACWAPYDTVKRRFTEAPRVGDAALQHALSVCGVRPDSGRLPAVSGPEPVAAPEPAAATVARRTAGASRGKEGVPESRGDFAATHAGRSREAAPAPGEEGPVRCAGTECGRPLTRGQQEMSLRSHGKPLCPTCQKALATVSDPGAAANSARK